MPLSNPFLVCWVALSAQLGVQDWTEFGQVEPETLPKVEPRINPELTPEQIERETGPDAWRWDYSATDIGETIGFVAGQERRLLRIGVVDPSSSRRATRLLTRFRKQFGDSMDALYDNARAREEGFDLALRREFEAPFVEIDAWNPDAAEIAEFLDAVELQLDGYLHTPVVEALLSFHPKYCESPEAELEDGFWLTYSTEGHQKAHGLTVDIAYPLSWLAFEADQESVTQIIQSKGGYGQTSVTISVVDEVFADPGVHTRKQLELALPARTFASQMKRARYIDHEMTEIDGRPALLMDFFVSRSSEAGPVHSFARGLYVAVGTKLVIIQGMQAGAIPMGYPPFDDDKLIAQFTHYEKLIAMMFDSIEFTE